MYYIVFVCVCVCITGDTVHERLWRKQMCETLDARLGHLIIFIACIIGISVLFQEVNVFVGAFVLLVFIFIIMLVVFGHIDISM